MNPARSVWLGDSCVSIHFGETIDPAINARCIAVAASVQNLGLPGVRDVIPSYAAVTIHFDPRVVDRRTLSSQLHRLAAAPQPEAAFAGRVVDVPVRYGGDGGPDLADVAAFAGCRESDVVQMHASTAYRVYMMGFLPGFAYMGPVDSRIAMPRLETPRFRVAAGSVGIAGAQTGIYPCDSPGGWRIIGRTSLKLFEPTREEPFLVKPGDRVRFIPE